MSTSLRKAQVSSQPPLCPIRSLGTWAEYISPLWFRSPCCCPAVSVTVTLPLLIQQGLRKGRVSEGLFIQTPWLPRCSFEHLQFSEQAPVSSWDENHWFLCTDVETEAQEASGLLNVTQLKDMSRTPSRVFRAKHRFTVELSLCLSQQMESPSMVGSGSWQALWSERDKLSQVYRRWR